MKFIKLGLIFITVGLFVFACTQNETTKNNPVNTVNKPSNAAPSAQPTAAPDEMASAKKIYTEKCARCHKDDGSGGKTEIDGTKINADSLIDEAAKKRTDAKYIEAVEKGFPDDGMPAFKGKLTDAEIKDVVKYVRTVLQK